MLKTKEIIKVLKRKSPETVRTGTGDFWIQTYFNGKTGKIMIVSQEALLYNVDMGNHRAGRLTLHSMERALFMPQGHIAKTAIRCLLIFFNITKVVYRCLISYFIKKLANSQ